MNQESLCPIWDTPAYRESLFDRDVERIDSPRAAGQYSIGIATGACSTYICPHWRWTVQGK